MLQKLKISLEKKNDIFDIFAENMDSGYTLEPPHRGSSNEYPQSTFWIKNKKKKKNGIPRLYTLVLLNKRGAYGVTLFTDMFV